MTSANSVVRAALILRYPVFDDVADATIDAFLDDARLFVPLCRLGDRQDLALMYKAASLMSSSPDLASTLAAGSVKRQKDGDVEIEYQATGSSSSSSSAYPNFEQLYQSVVRTAARISPMVLGYTD